MTTFLTHLPVREEFMSRAEDDIEMIIRWMDGHYSFEHYLQKFKSHPELPLLFENTKVPVTVDSALPWVICIANVTGAGRDTLVQHLHQAGLGQVATTATSRQRRSHENENAYVWMRMRGARESAQDYYQRLVKEYDLIEYDVHDGNLYGLPRRNFEQALKRGTVVIGNEPNGVKTLRQVLAGQANILAFMVVPDSWQQIYTRIRKPGVERDNIADRLFDSLQRLFVAEEVVNYIVHSTEVSVISGKSGMDTMKESVEWLVRKYADKNYSN